MEEEKKEISKKLKVSKGYRLKESTHRMIKKLQEELNYTQDKVISSAMRAYSNRLKRNNN